MHSSYPPFKLALLGLRFVSASLTLLLRPIIKKREYTGNRIKLKSTKTVSFVLRDRASVSSEIADSRPLLAGESEEVGGGPYNFSNNAKDPNISGSKTYTVISVASHNRTYGKCLRKTIRNIWGKK